MSIRLMYHEYTTHPTSVVYSWYKAPEGTVTGLGKQIKKSRNKKKNLWLSAELPNPGFQRLAIPEEGVVGLHQLAFQAEFLLGNGGGRDTEKQGQLGIAETKLEQQAETNIGGGKFRETFGQAGGETGIDLVDQRLQVMPVSLGQVLGLGAQARNTLVTVYLHRHQLMHPVLQLTVAVGQFLHQFQFAGHGAFLILPHPAAQFGVFLTQLLAALFEHRHCPLHFFTRLVVDRKILEQTPQTGQTALAAVEFALVFTPCDGRTRTPAIPPRLLKQIFQTPHGSKKGNGQDAHQKILPLISGEQRKGEMVIPFYRPKETDVHHPGVRTRS